MGLKFLPFDKAPGDFIAEHTHKLKSSLLDQRADDSPHSGWWHLSPCNYRQLRKPKSNLHYSRRKSTDYSTDFWKTRAGWGVFICHHYSPTTCYNCVHIYNTLQYTWFTHTISSHPLVNHLGDRPVFSTLKKSKCESQSQVTCLRPYNKKVRIPDTNPGARPVPHYPRVHDLFTKILLLPSFIYSKHELLSQLRRMVFCCSLFNVHHIRLSHNVTISFLEKN